MKNILKKITHIICVIIIICCTAYLLFWGYQVASSTRTIVEAKSIYSVSSVSKKSKSTNKETKLNNDYVGWLTIPNTNIDYPVVQTTNNKFYLKHNLNKEFNKYGTPFIDYRCIETHNIIIYAHHFQYQNSVMFGNLENLYSAQTKRNVNLSFSGKKYTLVGSFFTTASEALSDTYTSAYNTPVKNNDEWKIYVQELKKKLSYLNCTISDKDKLLLLSTCSYNKEDERFVVVFKAA